MSMKINVSREELTDCFRTVFDVQETVALITALVSLLNSVQGENIEPIKSAIAKIMFTLPEEMADAMSAQIEAQGFGKIKVGVVRPESSTLQ